MNAPKVQSLIQFAAERGLVTQYEVSSHIHAGLRSASEGKAYRRRNEQALARLDAAAEQTKVAYEQAIKAGEVAAPEPRTLRDIAAGHPDLTSTQAALRLLQKMEAKKSQRAAARVGSPACESTAAVAAAHHIGDEVKQ
jgi:hypothetical protein